MVPSRWGFVTMVRKSILVPEEGGGGNQIFLCQFPQSPWKDRKISVRHQRNINETETCTVVILQSTTRTNR